MDRWNGFGVLVVGLLTATGWADGLLGTPDCPPKDGFREIQCNLDGDKEPDSVRLYHVRARTEDGCFTSVAVFLLRRQSYLVPIHAITHAGRFPNMLSVMPVDLDDDGTSEFIVGESDAGISHSHTRFTVLDITLSGDGEVTTEVQFTYDAQDCGGPVTVESLGSKGHYRLRIADTSFHLVNGRDARKQGERATPRMAE